MINKFFFISVLLFLIILIPERTAEFNQSLNLFYTGIYFLLLTFFFIGNKKYTRNWFRLDVMFLIGFTIVHIQIPFLAAIGIEPSHPDLVWINKDVVNFATWLSVVSGLLWMYGYSTYNQITDQNIRKIYTIKKTNFFIHDCLLLISFILFLLTAGASVFSGTYDGGKSWGSGASYMYLIVSSLMYLRVIYFFKELPRNSSLLKVFNKLLSNLMFVITMLSFILIFLLIGDRGPILRLVLIIVGAYSLFVRPISFKKLLIVVLIGSLVFTILGLGRSKHVDDFNSQNIFERGYNSLVDSERKILTDELATSNRILYMALDLVPEKHDYLNGTTFLVNASGAFPMLSGLVVEVFDIPQIYRGSSHFFTITSLGVNPTWGVGSEVIADIYINFGVFGVFILMFLFGRFSAKLFTKARYYNMTYIVVYLCFLMDSISINRGSLLYPLPWIVYLLILHNTLLLINKSLSRFTQPSF